MGYYTASRAVTLCLCFQASTGEWFDACVDVQFVMTCARSPARCAVALRWPPSTRRSLTTRATRPRTPRRLRFHGRRWTTLPAAAASDGWELQIAQEGDIAGVLARPPVTGNRMPSSWVYENVTAEVGKWRRIGTGKSRVQSCDADGLLCNL